MIFLSADLHIGHKLLRRIRGFSELAPDEMDDHIVRVWNETVSEKDETYLLGDVALCNPTRALAILNQLHGRIYLVRGNHDKWIGKGRVGKMTVNRFEWIKDRHLLRCPNGERAVLSHEPYETWEGAHRGVFHFHGHSHGSGRRTGRRRDVGWDVYKKPMPLDTLLANMKHERYEPVDHHRA